MDSHYRSDNGLTIRGVISSKFNELCTSKKDRVNKGNEIKSFSQNYCVLDLETTDFSINSAEIIEIGILKVRNNIVVDEFSSLVCPPCNIPNRVSLINNITDEMVKEAPTFEEIIDDVLEFIGDDIVVGHNVNRFDINIIYDKALSLRSIFFSNDFIDTLEMASRSNVPTSDNKLSTLSEYFGEAIDGEHRALKDCMLNKVVYEKLWENHGKSCFYGKHNCNSSNRDKSNFVRPKYSDKTLALQELNCLVENIIADGEVTNSEAEELNAWIETHKELSNEYPCNKIVDLLQTVFMDGFISAEERESINKLLIEILDPVSSHNEKCRIDCVDGKHICLTGDFELGSRSEIEMTLEEQGAIIDKNVKKATNFLIVGGHGSSAWTSGSYGNKVKKAIEFNDKYKDSVNIKIFREEALVHLLK